MEDAEEPVEVDPSGRFERYNIQLGKGAYKLVFKAYDTEEGREVAWNQLRLDNFHKVDSQRILGEIKILQSLRNEHIINLYHAWISRTADGKERICFITELMTSGTLKSFIRRTKGPIKPKVLKSWASQILQGLNYLHTRNPPIIHRDVKCENIFINGNNGQAKIGDLGLATMKSREHVSSVLGTPEFMAPELYDEKYDEKVDIYAFGMVILEIVTKEYPYSECQNQAQIYKKVSSGIKPNALAGITDEETRKFIDLCIAFNPNDRPPASEILKHPFLNLSVAAANSSALSVLSDTSERRIPYETNNQAEHPLSDTQNITTYETPAPVTIITTPPSVNSSIHKLNGNPPALGKMKPSSTESTHSNEQRKEVRMVDAHHHSYQVGRPANLHMSTASTKTGSSVSTNSVVTSQSSSTSLVVTIESITEDNISLKMTYTSPNMKPQEIKFPFNLTTDTVTDVVSEMVGENLIDAKDEGLTRRKLEEVIRGLLMKSRSNSTSSNKRDSDSDMTASIPMEGQNPSDSRANDLAARPPSQRRSMNEEKNGKQQWPSIATTTEEVLRRNATVNTGGWSIPRVPSPARIPNTGQVQSETSSKPQSTSASPALAPTHGFDTTTTGTSGFQRGMSLSSSSSTEDKPSTAESSLARKEKNEELQKKIMEMQEKAVFGFQKDKQGNSMGSGLNLNASMRR